MAMPRQEERVKNPKARWYFTKEELANSPSRREHGVEVDKELSYRQQAANMIQDMGQKLNVNQLCINTAIVYMHRFYVVHSFKTFNRHLVATASLFLAAKSEEQPRKLQYVAQASYACLHKDQPMLDVQSQTYTKLIEDITYYELLLLETLGFEVQVDHPHPHVVKCMQFLRANKDLAQMAYFMAHNSLLLTTFCLEHTPSTVACVCIHLSCRWKGLEIPRSSDGKNWWEYIDPSINRTKLDELTKEFLMIYDKSPSRLQKKITEPVRGQGISSGQSSTGVSISKSSPAVCLTSDKGKQPSGIHGHSSKRTQPKSNQHTESGGHGNRPHPPTSGEHKNPHATSLVKDHKQPPIHSKSPVVPHSKPQSGERSHHNPHPHPPGDRQAATKPNQPPHLNKPHHRQHPQLTDAHGHSHLKPAEQSRPHPLHPPGRGVKRYHVGEKEAQTQGKKRVKMEHGSNSQPPLPPTHDFPPLPPLPTGPPPPPNSTGTLHPLHPPLFPPPSQQQQQQHYHGLHNKHRVNSLAPPLPPPLPPSPSPPPPPPPR